MSRFVEGCDRRQPTLLPECLDNYVAGENPVRVVDVFVDDLDLGALTLRASPRRRRARRYYGVAKLYGVIFEADREVLDNADEIFVSNVLRTPPKPPTRQQ